MQVSKDWGNRGKPKFETYAPFLRGKLHIPLLFHDKFNRYLELIELSIGVGCKMPQRPQKTPKVDDSKTLSWVKKNTSHL